MLHWQCPVQTELNSQAKAACALGREEEDKTQLKQQGCMNLTQSSCLCKQFSAFCVHAYLIWYRLHVRGANEIEAVKYVRKSARLLSCRLATVWSGTHFINTSAQSMQGALGQSVHSSHCSVQTPDAAANSRLFRGSRAWKAGQHLLFLVGWGMQ